MFILVLSGCSIEVNESVENTPSPTLKAMPTLASTSTFPTTRIPVTWTSLNLSGKLIFLSSSMENIYSIANIQFLDLTTGALSTIFRAPPGGWVYYATISPDAKQLIMSYQPPSEANSAVSNRMLYTLPLDAPASPKPLFVPPTTDDRYTQVELSPGGKYVYYVHYNHKDAAGQFYEVYEIFRMVYPNGNPEKLLDRAFWPRLSTDGSKLAYVTLDPATGLNELFIANADGSQPQKINFSGPWIPDIIDAPIFSPDNRFLLFSAPAPSQSYQPNWFEKALGIQIAKAHSVPSDWWSVPVTGGVPTRLTNLQTINLFATLLPDHERIVSINGDGLFLMNLDGSNLTQLISDSGVHGTVSWIP